MPEKIEINTRSGGEDFSVAGPVSKESKQVYNS